MAQPQQAPHLPVQRPQIALPQMSHPQMPQMQQQQHQIQQQQYQMQQQQHQMQQQHQQHQQISQMSPQLAPRVVYQQAQNSPSPVNTSQPTYGMNPHKRQRVSPAPAPPQNNSQPASPYLPTATYTMSPQPHNAPSPAALSPNYGNVPAAASPQPYSAPYTNGNMASMVPASAATPGGILSPVTMPSPAAQTLHLPEARPSQPPTPAPLRPAAPSPATPSLPTTQHQYTMATLAPAVPSPASNAGTMGPPSKPAEKPTKEYEYDISDSLAGTGVDLRAEEQALAEYYAGSFLPDSRTGLPSNPPGTKDSMYGAGWANQPGPPPDGKTQEEWEVEVAKKAWDEAALRLAHIRSNEINNPFCQVSVLHYKANKIAQEYGLELHLDSKTQGGVGKMRLPHDFYEKPTIKVSTKVADGGAVLMTTGSWIPKDSYLVDQLALLSIATKHRVKELVEEANVIATTRQTTSHGEVPEEWADVAVPLKSGLEVLDTPESAVSPRTNPLKRSFDGASKEPSFGGKDAQIHILNRDLRDTQKAERMAEEARLKKRQKRLNPEKAGTAKTAATPGTPGGAAPEGEQPKAVPKKETKKSLKEKSMSLASSMTDANSTVSTLFGKKKNKKYSWMDGGGAASSPSTPKPSGGSASAAASPGPGRPAPAASLTVEQRIKLGHWRENEELGKGIQLRDWVVVLQRDGKDFKAIQSALDKLDTPGK